MYKHSFIYFFWNLENDNTKSFVRGFFILELILIILKLTYINLSLVELLLQRSKIK